MSSSNSVHLFGLLYPACGAARDAAGVALRSRRRRSVKLTVSLVVGFVAALVQLVGYCAYARLLLRGDIVANPSSWSLWALGSIIEVFAYGAVTHDIAKLALPAACCLASIMIAAATLYQARFSRPDLTDVGAALMDVGVILVWVFSHNADLTYIWFLVDVLLTFVPIIRSTYSHPEDEQVFPWFIWTAAYGILFADCILRWEGVEALLLPALYVICNVTVGVLAIRRRGERHGHSANPRNSPSA